VAVGLACVAIAVIALWVLAGYAGSHASATSGDRDVSARVRTSASCVGADTNDTVTFTVDGAPHLAKLNGCGHQTGEVLNVLVPATFTGDTVLDLADVAPGDSTGLSHRVAFLLLVLATAVGGGCGYQIFRIRNRAARPAKRSIKTVGPTPFGRPTDADDQPTPDDAADSGRADSGRAGSGRASSSRPNLARAGSRGGRLAARFRSSAADRDEVYPGETRAPSPDDPDTTGVDWFEDSSAHMHPVERPHNAG
jgi:hypothetical protein